MKCSAYDDVLNWPAFNISVALLGVSRLRLQNASHKSEKFFEDCIKNSDTPTTEPNGEPQAFQYANITRNDILPVSFISCEMKIVSVSFARI